ncbi:hypothetical protein [Pseudomonas uvaldensis]|uniref:hypothetical protein n=1 Tax=Pseudomonas uvaldensis TaxID=2878385 RepID=UPI001E4F3E17|nr:hypothetical protein [Pseudomonas uvaldensis]MCE0461010.1 hypothetical protein [Pseudomonas uvaldensis]
MSDVKILPEPREVEEAMRNPNGWVYRIYGHYGANDAVPPEAVIGAWKVNEKGLIVGDFILNPKFSLDDKGPK